MTSRPTTSPADDIIDEAARWKTRLLSGDTPRAVRLEFEAWLAESPENGAAFADVDDFWESLGAFGDCPAVLKEQRDAELERQRACARGRQQGSRRVRMAWAGIAAALLLAVTGTAAWNLIRESNLRDRGRIAGQDTPSIVYETLRGEQRRYVLADGSAIHLNTDTAIAVSFSDGERRLELSRGQALFSVAHDPSRPFVVAAGQMSVRALGTEFEVFLRGDDVRVAVTDGIVEVRESGKPADDPDRLATKLARGQQATFTRVAVLQPVQTANISQVAAWRTGKLIFASTPLAEAVDDFNRYTEKQILIADNKLDGLRISGVFRNSDSDQFVRALAAQFPITFRVEASGDTVLEAVH